MGALVEISRSFSLKGAGVVTFAVFSRAAHDLSDWVGLVSRQSCNQEGGEEAFSGCELYQTEGATTGTEFAGADRLNAERCW